MSRSSWACLHQRMPLGGGPLAGDTGGGSTGSPTRGNGCIRVIGGVGQGCVLCAVEAIVGGHSQGGRR